jgi:hypothetical protein
VGGDGVGGAAHLRDRRSRPVVRPRHRQRAGRGELPWDLREHRLRAVDDELLHRRGGRRRHERPEELVDQRVDHLRVERVGDDVEERLVVERDDVGVGEQAAQPVDPVAAAVVAVDVAEDAGLTGAVLLPWLNRVSRSWGTSLNRGSLTPRYSP